MSDRISSRIGFIPRLFGRNNNTSGAQYCDVVGILVVQLSDGAHGGHRGLARRFGMCVEVNERVGHSLEGPIVLVHVEVKLWGKVPVRTLGIGVCLEWWTAVLTLITAVVSMVPAIRAAGIRVLMETAGDGVCINASPVVIGTIRSVSRAIEISTVSMRA
jgi:hypothetical protein